MVTSKWYTQFQVYFAHIIASSESTLVCSNEDCLRLSNKPLFFLDLTISFYFNSCMYVPRKSTTSVECLLGT
ncbi:hypothetical protein AALO_G00203140 [Alosa alosa]|uniref:Uncharacterized protein n=1 Tax=Alosa alosa TaxID=278164 RepID=A0AAV6G338_9TELE|nr:hypothetical protein AALO_G00203140 [Alosa alosa]